MRTAIFPFPLGTAVIFFIYVIHFGTTASVDSKTIVGPSILHSDSNDEDIIVSSGHAWGSGSGHLVLDGYDQEDDDEDIHSTKATPLRLSTPESTRMSCIVCTTVGDPSCSDPYIRNASHVKTCQTSVEGCLKVVTPTGDTYRNCLYGIFGTAEHTTGCRVVKEDVHIGHRFVNSTICVCGTNECNRFFYTTTPGVDRATSSVDQPTEKTTEKPEISKIFVENFSSTKNSLVPKLQIDNSKRISSSGNSSFSGLKYSSTIICAFIGWLFSTILIRKSFSFQFLSF